MKDIPQAEQDLALIKNTLEISQGTRYFRIILLSFGGYFVFSGVLILAALSAVYAMIHYSVDTSWIVLLISVVYVGLSLAKISCIKKAAQKENIPLRELFSNSVFSSRFLMFYTPHLFTALSVIVYLISAGQARHSIPAVLFIFGYSTNSVGILFRLRSYTIMAWLFILLAVTGLFFLMDYPYILSGIGFGLMVIVAGLCIEIEKRRN
ncbi:MAG: hypothetical protein ACQEQ4_04505 [Fibrobacterota bacterium]